MRYLKKKWIFYVVEWSNKLLPESAGWLVEPGGCWGALSDMLWVRRALVEMPMFPTGVLERSLPEDTLLDSQRLTMNLSGLAFHHDPVVFVTDTVRRKINTSCFMTFSPQLRSQYDYYKSKYFLSLPLSEPSLTQVGRRHSAGSGFCISFVITASVILVSSKYLSSDKSYKWNVNEMARMQRTPSDSELCSAECT